MTIYIGLQYLQSLGKWYMQWIAIATMGVLVSCSSHDDPAYSQLKEIYNDGVKAQKAEAYTNALQKYARCIYECSSDQYTQNDSIKQLLPKAMIQLLNTYQSLGQPQKCIAYFDSLRTETSHPDVHHNKVLTSYFKRDVYVLLSYSLSRTEQEDSAARLMDEALQMPLSYPSHERLFCHYAYAAGVYYCVPSYHDKVLKYGNLALAEAKHCERNSSVQWLVGCLGKMYMNTGDVSKAISMYREGYDIAEQNHDTLGMANTKNLFVDFMMRWKLYGEANRYATDAVNLIKAMGNPNPMVKSNIYINKAKTLLAMGKTQDALTYLKDAKDICKDLPYNSGMSDVDLLIGKALIAKGKALTTKEKGKGDEIQGKGDEIQGMKLLDNVSHEASFSLKAQAFYELAKIHLKKGDTALGEQNLDSMYATLNQACPPIFIDGAYNFALDHYLLKGDQAKIALYAKGIRDEKAEQEKNGMMKSVTQSLVRIELEKQRRLMVQKVEDMEQRKLLDIFAICFLACCILGGFFYFLKKRKEAHAKSMRDELKLTEKQQKLTETEQKLAIVTEDKAQVEQSLAAMSKDKEQVELSLAAISKDKEQVEQSLAAMSKDKEQVEKQLRSIEQKDVDKVKAGISLPDILKEKGDIKFKEYFNRSYPYFLKELRKEADHITSKEELYCMLIALGQTNQELSTVFNVARSSVTIAKYRLRKKLPLKGNQTMEIYLDRLITKHENLVFTEEETERHQNPAPTEE